MLQREHSLHDRMHTLDVGDADDADGDAWLHIDMYVNAFTSA